MQAQDPITETMKISEVKQRLNSLVNRVYRRETRVMIEKAGIPVAGIVSADDLRRLDRLDREWEEGTRAIERFGAAFEDIPTEELEAAISRIIADIRRQEEGESERQSA